jgi:hypothetical protein
LCHDSHEFAVGVYHRDPSDLAFNHDLTQILHLILRHAGDGVRGHRLPDQDVWSLADGKDTYGEVAVCHRAYQTIGVGVLDYRDRATVVVSHQGSCLTDTGLRSTASRVRGHDLFDSHVSSMGGWTLIVRLLGPLAR